MSPIKEQLSPAELAGNLQQRVETALATRLPEAGIHPRRLHEAMRYSVLDGGKRIRPLLVYFSGQALHCPPPRLDSVACAVELIHVYSLVHDDLPAMDDDDLRRGKPTCHKAFDEATAILVGDALQALAFSILAEDPALTASPAQRLKMVACLAHAAGSRGMVGGQAIDLAATGQELDIAQLEDMHIHKTGALIRACVRLSCLCAPETTEQDHQALDKFSKNIGLAFQIRDDILDVEGTTKTLGKKCGTDQAQQKPTYPAIVGLAAAKELAEELYQRAIEALAGLGPRAEPLRWLARFVIHRDC